MDSSSIYVERNFSPSSCAKTWIFVKTPHYHASYQKSSLVVSTYCLQEQNMSCCPLMKNGQQRWKGKESIWSRRWVFWCGSFWKKSLLVLKLEKIVYPEFILSWQELWFSVFRYCGKCFLAFFSDFISSPPLLFLKKHTNTHTTITEQKEEKRKEKEILLLMVCEKPPSPRLLSLKWEIMTDVFSFFFFFFKAKGGGKKGFSCFGILPRFLF